MSPKELAIGSTVYSCIFFQGNQSWWILSCPRRLSVWPSLLTTTPRPFSLRESLFVSSLLTVFLTLAHSGKPIFSPFVNIFFFTKIYLSIYITHSSVNFTWFALLSSQKFNDRPLFKPGALFNFLPFWIASKQIF